MTTTRALGNMKSSQARHRLSRCAVVPKICWLEQRHTNLVIQAIAPESSDSSPQVADASYTTDNQLGCAVLTADCLPIVLWHRQQPWVAAVHAGWQGLYKEILQRTVQAAMVQPNALVAWIGPSISRAYYEVQPDFKDLFLSKYSNYGEAFTYRGDSLFCDLQKIAIKQLQAIGIGQIHQSYYCTYAEPQLFDSYRRQGAHSGRQATVVWLEK